MIGGVHWGDLANYVTATAPIVALIAWLGRVLWKNIRHELQPNSGTSLRDAIDRIEENVVNMRGEVQRIDKSLERHLGYHDAADRLPTPSSGE